MSASTKVKKPQLLTEFTQRNMVTWLMFLYQQKNYLLLVN
jgi:hypothetical protein